MEFTPTATEKKPAQVKQLVVDYLTDKRKSLGVFKIMEVKHLESVKCRLLDVLTLKVKEAECEAQRIISEKIAVDLAVDKALLHLETQGLKFNRQDVAKLLAANVKLGDAPTKTVATLATKESMQSGNSYESTNPE